MNASRDRRRPAGVGFLISTMLLLVSCAGTSTLVNRDWQEHYASVAAFDVWELRGRLNIRQPGRSDTVNLDWSQRQEDFSIHLSGTLGLGAVYLHGGDAAVTLEKAGSEPLQLPSLDRIGREYLGYDLPAAYLRYWARGIPVPKLKADTTLDEHNLLATLSQRGPDGRLWELEFDRYRRVGTLNLPGRIRLRNRDVQLTLLVTDWKPA